MVILYVAGLSNKKFAGPNINVPANVIYGGKYAITGLYNTGTDCLENAKKIEHFFNREMVINNDISSLPEPFNKPDLVVFNSMYIVDHAIIAKKLKKNGIPYIIIPRGAMTDKAQKKKRYKKIMGNFFIFKKYVKNAKCIQFLTENEYLESRKFKFNNYIISGNGTSRKNVVKNYNDIENKKDFIISFIGRLEKYHKGLDILVEAINLGKEDFRNNNIKFNFYGPDDNNSVSYLFEQIKKYNIEDLISINEPVFDEEKEKVLLNTDLFIHTSRLEGHPTSIIEAISYGIPVLVTPGTNVADEVCSNNLGYVTELNPISIKNNILLAYNSKDNFAEISKNEIKYSSKNFEWDVIMKNTIDKYKKLIT